jgi:hypothetical protein
MRLEVVSLRVRREVVLKWVVIRVQALWISGVTVGFLLESVTQPLLGLLNNLL